MAKLHNLLLILAVEGKENIPSGEKESVGFWAVPVSLSAKASCFARVLLTATECQPAFETSSLALGEEGTGSCVTLPGPLSLPEEGCFSFLGVAVGGYPCASGTIFSGPTTLLLFWLGNKNFPFLHLLVTLGGSFCPHFDPCGGSSL